MKIVILGLSITSSWGNGHATTYRGLVRELIARGHDVLFLERDQPWYAEHRDLAPSDELGVRLYPAVAALREEFADEVANADCVVVGSYVPEGIAVGTWVNETAGGLTAFYDIDTPVTLAALRHNACDYLSVPLIGSYDLYLSFTGGPTLQVLEKEFGAAQAEAFYCSVDPEAYYPDSIAKHWALGYLGTFSPDRQPSVESLLIEPARELPEQRFVVAGPQYPADFAWPGNVERIPHLSPADHRGFYNGQRFTLNVTRAEMIRLGWSPSVRLFEAAACGTPIISDGWDGLEAFFRPGAEILVAANCAEVTSILRDLPESERLNIAGRARTKVLREHTAAQRAVQLERLIERAAGPTLPPAVQQPEEIAL
jgi:spore maturation protein CgeB